MTQARNGDPLDGNRPTKSRLSRSMISAGSLMFKTLDRGKKVGVVLHSLHSLHSLQPKCVLCNAKNPMQRIAGAGNPKEGEQVIIEVEHLYLCLFFLSQGFQGAIHSTARQAMPMIE
jgi:hypothetical protein